MDILIVGGSGRISGDVTRCLVAAGFCVYVLNRGNTNQSIGCKHFKCDINSEDAFVILANRKFDVVIDFVSFTLVDVAKRYRLFKDKTQQYIFISSMTVCNAKRQIIYNEKTLVGNPYSQYARDKIECEQYLMQKYTIHKFPVTIIRPSQTYNDKTVPVGVHGMNGSWQVVKRIQEGKPIIIHGDGNSIWSVTRSEEFAKWLLGIVGNLDTIGEIIQIVNNEMLTWNQIYSIIADELGQKLYPLYISSRKLVSYDNMFRLEESLLGDKTRTMIFDNTKLKQYSRYSPELSAENGIRCAVRGVLSMPESQKEDKCFDLWCDWVCSKERI